MLQHCYKPRGLKVVPKSKAEVTEIVMANMYLVDRYTAKFRKFYFYDELVASAKEGLVLAASMYEPGKASFASFAYYLIRSACLGSGNDAPYIINASSFDSDDSDGDDIIDSFSGQPAEDFETVELRKDFKAIYKRAREIFVRLHRYEPRYPAAITDYGHWFDAFYDIEFGDMRLEEVAVSAGITRQAVSLKLIRCRPRFYKALAMAGKQC
jgi:hypothetical protein